MKNPNFPDDIIPEYHKIETVYNRATDGSKKLIIGAFRDEAVEFLADCEWVFTEKVDGTNIRIVWDGHKVSFLSRTERASIPAKLSNYLVEAFGTEVAEEVFEQKFGSTPVILFGEGYGAGIQQPIGEQYQEGQRFILFDVLVGKTMLKREDVNSIGLIMGVPVVPVVLTGTIAEGVEYIMAKPQSQLGTCPMEGLVGCPKVELLNRMRRRIIVKIKRRDFESE